MGNLLQRAASPEIVNAAWRRSKKDRAPWAAGIDRDEMERNIGLHLVRLSQELAAGDYAPDPVRYMPVHKGDGSRRIISAITLRDKVAQRAVLKVVEPLAEKTFHPDSYAYRPGRTIGMAAARAREYILCGMGWVVDADIQSFFDHISHRRLLRKLTALIPDRELVALIRRWVDAGAVRRGFLSAVRGIPQGAVISPLLCNIYLTEWDHAMAARNLPFVRFADDFLVFARTESDARKARDFTEKALSALDLRLHPKKTRVTSCGPHVRFLGHKLPKPVAPAAA